MKLLLLVLAVCTFATGMVPRLRRAIDEEGTTSTLKPICSPSTPCGWVFYKKHPDHIDSIKDNDYCECASNMVCEIDGEDDKTAESLIRKCKLES